MRIQEVKCGGGLMSGETKLDDLNSRVAELENAVAKLRKSLEDLVAEVKDIRFKIQDIEDDCDALKKRLGVR